MSRNERDAGVWAAFAAGMYTESLMHASQFTGEELPPDIARLRFLEDCGDLMAVLGVTTSEALASYDAGRQMMRETRNAARPVRTVEEDGPPLLTGKPDRRLS